MLTTVPTTDINLVEARIAFRACFDSIRDAVDYEARVLSIGRAFLPPCALAVLDGGEPSAAWYEFLLEQIDAADLLIIGGMSKAEARAVVLVRMAGPPAPVATEFEIQARYLASLPEFVVSLTAVRGATIARALPEARGNVDGDDVEGARERLDRVVVTSEFMLIENCPPELAEEVRALVAEGELSLLEALERILDRGSCEGHEPGPSEPMGISVLCDGSCRGRKARRLAAAVIELRIA